MSSYAQQLRGRFDDACGPDDAELPELPFVRQVLGRKTVRAYTDVVPADSLLALLCAAALSASAKSDFQQASILRVLDPGKRARIAAFFPAMPWIGTAPVFFVFLGDARRLERVGELRGKPVANGTLEGFLTPPLMRPWCCRRSSSRRKARGSAAVRSASSATGWIRLPRS